MYVDVLIRQRSETSWVTILAGFIYDVFCLQETQWPDGFDERCGNYRHIGMTSQSRHYGLAFSVYMQFEKQIDRYWYQWYVSDRLAVIQLRISNNSILTIINVYGPTSQRVNNNNAEQDEFYAELARLTSQYSSSALLCRVCIVIRRTLVRCRLLVHLPKWQPCNHDSYKVFWWFWVPMRSLMKSDLVAQLEFLENSCNSSKSNMATPVEGK